MGKVEFYEKAGLTRSIPPVARPAVVPTGLEVIQAQTTLEPAHFDPCPMCGANVDWFGLPARRSLVAVLLKHGYFRKCPQCKREKEVPG